MKFLLELVAFCTCGCVSCSWGSKAEETRSLLAREPTRRRTRGRRVRRGGHEWRPSLSSISEDSALMAENSGKYCNAAGRPAAGRRRNLKKTAGSQRDRPRSSAMANDYYFRRAPMIMPSFSPTPFMF